jgi:multidrug efflux pump subunit AcrB
MRISDFSVRNYQFTVVVFLMAAALGASSWLSIPRSEDPTFPVPISTVVAVYPGANPTDIERLVVKKIEDRVAELDELKRMTSRIEDGLATIRVEFQANSDADKKYDEVLREVNSLRGSLPPELTLLEVRKSSPLDVNIVQLALVSELASYRTLDSLAEQLEDRIETVPGVRRGERWAAPAREVRVSLDLGRLSQLGLTPGQVLQAIGSESADIPGGSVDAGLRRFNVKTSGSYATIDEVKRTVVGAARGGLVRVSDVAQVEWGYADPTYIGRYNGHRAVFVTATQQEGQNIERVRDGIWKELDTFERTLPPTVKLARAFDQASNVSHRLSRLGTDFAIAIGLVLVTLLPLGLRASLIVMISIPLSLAIGVTLLDLTGFSINQLSIVGFVIALGLLVDDSIVVAENITRFLREGHSRRDAAILATQQISVAILGCTATLILAFVPLLVLPGLPGKYIRSLPITVVYTVAASLLVSLTIIPWLGSLILKDHAGENRVLRAFTGGIHRTYAPLLRLALAYPRRTLIVAGTVVVASLALVPAVGFSLFPKAETPRFEVDIRTPNGSSLDATDRAARFAERVLSARPEVKAVFTSVGRDNPQVYYNVTPREENASVGQLFVLLDRYDPRSTPALLDRFREALAAYPDARLELREFENGPPIDAPIALRVAGPDLDTLRGLAVQIENVLRRTAGTQYVYNPVRVRRTDLRLAIDEQKAGLLGVPTAEIDRTVRLGVAGLTAGKLREGDGKERDVVVRLANAGRPTTEVLDRVYVPAAGGALTPLRQVADFGFEASTPEIQRYDEERAVTVTANVATGYNTDRVTKRVLAALDSLKLPAGYRITPAGEIESRQESFGGIGGAVIVAVFMTIAILVLEFRTFRSTLIVASVIPLGLVGGILALLLTGNTLSFTALIGFVALIGIEIKTSILLVDLTNQLRAQGLPLDEAIQKAGEVRFLPILLTALTAIGGLLPIAHQGAALYAPLAWVIIGGLLSSTLLARLVTPVLYKVLAPAVGAAAGPGTQS